MKPLILLLLVIGTGPNSAGSETNGGDTLEQCEAHGRTKVAELNALPMWRFTPGKSGPETIERTEKDFWRFQCIEMKRNP